MKKKLALMILALVCALAMTACGCKHETWNPADCETPKTCAECGETEGAPLGHSWAAATCETPKTCEICGKVDGEALGHAWADADCENPKTCGTCKLTEGEALGHSWQEATTEAPKTCATCAATEGERIITDPRFTTAATAEIQGKWAFPFNMSGEMMELDGFEKGIDCILNLDLGNDGTAILTIECVDLEAFERDMSEYLIQLLYDELAASGLSQEEAQEAIRATYGMSIEEYVGYAVKQMDVASLFAQMRVEMVYYVEEGKLYIDDSWTSDMGDPSEYILEGDTLTIHEDMSSIGIEEEKMVLTRVTDEG